MYLASLVHPKLSVAVDVFITMCEIDNAFLTGNYIFCIVHALKRYSYGVIRYRNRLDGLIAHGTHNMFLRSGLQGYNMWLTSVVACFGIPLFFTTVMPFFH